MGLKEQVVATEHLAQDLAECPLVTYLDDVQLLDGLLTQSIASAAVIACSDMGYQLPHVCSSTDAPLHIFQNFGHHYIDGGARETIFSLGIEHVIVYGHSNCQFADSLGTRQAQEGPGELPSENVGDDVRLAQLRESGNTGGISFSESLGRDRVLQELKGMTVDPFLLAMMAQGNRKLRLHGWFYNSRRLLEVFDPRAVGFVVTPHQV